MNELARARPLVGAALTRIALGEPADRVLAKTLRAHRELSSDERRAVAEWTLGIALWRGRLDAMARGRRELWLPLFLIDRERRDVAEVARMFELDLDDLRHASETPEPDDPIDTLSFRRSLPRWLASRWIDQFGLARADRIAATMNERGPLTIRANTLVTTRDELATKLSAESVVSHPTEFARDGLSLEGRVNVFGLRAWRDGLFEVQDEGSQLVAEAVEAKPGELVVDLCAGRGGKTLALAAAMRNEGRLVAIDIDAARRHDLEVRLSRAGVGIVESRLGDARERELTSDLESLADAVLVDAPCSELGVLRRSPDARWRIDESHLVRCAELQVELLRASSQLVRPGGRLVYATCSIDRTENEAVVETLDRQVAELVDVRRLSPDTDGTDGFFIARWRRR